MNDREVMLALFRATAAVYERVTGERLVINVPTEGGGVIMTSDGEHLAEAEKKVEPSEPSESLSGSPDRCPHTACGPRESEPARS